MSIISNKIVCFKNIKVPALLAAIVGIGLCGLAFSLNPEKMYQSYLYGFLVWMCLTLGCYGLTLLHHTVRGSWGLPLLRIFEAGSSATSFIIMGILFIPVLFGLPYLYPWANPEIVQHDHVLLHRASYMNQTAFAIRAIIYFSIWCVFSYLLRRSSVKEDRTLDPTETIKRINLSAPGIVVFIVTVNFAITDWVMSLTPHWYSTIFGAYFVVGSVLFAMAFGVFIVTKNAGSQPYVQIVSNALTKDFGNLLFVFSMVWTYFILSQFLITWSGNLPELNQFYVKRSESFLLYWGVFNIIGQFAIPFFVLIAPRVKASPRSLMLIAGWIFCMRFVELYWEISPMFGVSWPSWMDLAVLLGIGGLWLFNFSSQIQKASLLPENDQRLQEALEHA